MITGCLKKECEKTAVKSDLRWCALLLDTVPSESIGMARIIFFVFLFAVD